VPCPLYRSASPQSLAAYPASQGAAVVDLGPLGALTRLQTASLLGCELLVDARPLAGCAVLQYLDFSGCSKLEKLPACRSGLPDQLPHMQAYHTAPTAHLGCRGVSCLRREAGDSGLHGVRLRGCATLRDLAPLTGSKLGGGSIFCYGKPSLLQHSRIRSAQRRSMR
jgi:hypothetical protein